MASIERTAYPRFKRTFTSSELQQVYTPTLEEIKLARTVARGEIPVFSFLLLLKTFQRLGYFPRMTEIPKTIVNHIASRLGLASDIKPKIAETTLYKYHQGIREYLRVSPYSKVARQIVIKSIYQAAQVKDNPADLINVAIAELINQRYELPAFSTLDRIIRRIRTLVNGAFFRQVFQQLTPEALEELNKLLTTDSHTYRSPYNELKQFPKSPTLSHLRSLLAHLRWLQSLGNIEQLLKDIPSLKIQHFAAEAKALDVSEMQDLLPPKRYTLVLSLIHQSLIQTKDNLAHMFLKRLNTIHKRGKELREQITAATNKVEDYHRFSKWFFFGGEGIIATNEPEQQQKLIKYNDLVSNAVIFQNVVDLTQILRDLTREGYPLTRADVAALSPYLTRHIKRFGDYWLDWEITPGRLDVQQELELVG